MAHDTVSALRRTLAALGQQGGPSAPELFSLGAPRVDDGLGGGLARAALHELYAAQGGDAAAVSGFALGLALRASAGRSLIWIRQSHVETEAGWPFGAGLSAFGLDPSRLVLVRVRDPTSVLRAAAEASRCAALGGIIVELWGRPAVLDLTASRRLTLALQSSGIPLMLVRIGASPGPSSVASRWTVSSRASRPLEANAPGSPAFDIRLLYHRAGIPGRQWPLEWDRDRLSFADPAPVSRAVVPVPRGQPAASDAIGWRRAG